MARYHHGPFMMARGYCVDSYSAYSDSLSISIISVIILLVWVVVSV